MTDLAQHRRTQAATADTPARRALRFVAQPAALGLLLAWGGLAGIRAIYAGNHDTYESLTRMDLTVVLVTLGLSLVAGLAAGIYPAWRIGRTAPAVYLKSQ